MKTMKLITVACTAALLGTTAIADGDKVDLTTWDADSDKMVTQQEWADAIDEQGLFDRIDKNNNGNFDVEESMDEVLDYDLSMDLDDGGHISRDEFVVGLYNHYDENDDDRLDATELDAFHTATADSPLWMSEEEDSAVN